MAIFNSYFDITGGYFFKKKMVKFPHGPPEFFSPSPEIPEKQVFLPSSREERLAAQVRPGGETWGDRCVQRIWGVLPQ